MLIKGDTTRHRNPISWLWNRNIFLLVVAGRTGDFMFAWATKYADTAVVAVLYETWLICYILMRLLGHKDGHLSRTHLSIAGLLLFALPGVALVVFSQEGQAGFDWNPGVAIVLGAAILSAANIDRSVKFGRLVASEGKEVVWHTIMIVVCANLVIGMASLLIMLSQSALASAPWAGVSAGQLLWMIAIGTLSIAPAVLFARLAQLKTASLNIWTVYYLSPVLGLGLLALFSEVSIARMDWFLLGAGSIVGANLVLNLKFGGDTPKPPDAVAPSESTQIAL